MSVFPERPISSSYADDLGTETVSIVVGEEQKRYTVHKNLLTSQSEYFNKALNGGFREAGENAIHLEEDDPAAIALLVGWLYRGVIPEARNSSIYAPKAFDGPDKPVLLPAGGTSITVPMIRETEITRGLGIHNPQFQFENICAHSQYNIYSQEELRLADYVEGRRDKSNNSMSLDLKTEDITPLLISPEWNKFPVDVGRVAYSDPPEPNPILPTVPPGLFDTASSASSREGSSTPPDVESAQRTTTDNGARASQQSSTPHRSSATQASSPLNTHTNDGIDLTRLSLNASSSESSLPTNDASSKSSAASTIGNGSVFGARLNNASNSRHVFGVPAFSGATNSHTPEINSSPFCQGLVVRPAGTSPLAAQHDGAESSQSSTANVSSPTVEPHTGTTPTNSFLPTPSTGHNDQSFPAPFGAFSNHQNGFGTLQPASTTTRGLFNPSNTSTLFGNPRVASTQITNPLLPPSQSHTQSWDLRQDQNFNQPHHAYSTKPIFSYRTNPDHQTALLRLTIFAETTCWPRLFNAAMTTYTEGEKSLDRPPPLDHISLIYERTHDESPIRTWTVDSLASSKGEVDMSGYMSLLVEYEGFLAGVLTKLREKGKDKVEDEKSFKATPAFKYRMMEMAERKLFSKGKGKENAKS